MCRIPAGSGIPAADSNAGEAGPGGGQGRTADRRALQAAGMPLVKIAAPAAPSIASPCMAGTAAAAIWKRIIALLTKPTAQIPPVSPSRPGSLPSSLGSVSTAAVEISPAARTIQCRESRAAILHTAPAIPPMQPKKLSQSVPPSVRWRRDCSASRLRPASMDRARSFWTCRLSSWIARTSAVLFKARRA